jgi:hypothetical protein
MEDERTKEIRIQKEHMAKARKTYDGGVVMGQAVLNLLTDIDALWNLEGFGSEDEVSEPLKHRLETAIRELTGEDE